MSHHVSRRHVIVGTGALALAGSMITPGFADVQTHTVEMLNRDPDDPKRRMIYKPLIQVVEPGDIITFVPTDRGHNVVSIDGMLPEGVEEWNGRMNAEFTTTITTPGVYGYGCLPHLAMGMVGVVLCRGEGAMDNYEAAKSVRHRGRQAQVFEEIFAQIEADNLLG